MLSFRNSFTAVYFIVIICLFSCGNKRVFHDKDKIDLDQNVTNRNRPMDSVFLHFEKNWKKFISAEQVLVKPVNTDLQDVWEPSIISDCIYSAEAGIYVPYVEFSWNSIPTQKRVRFDVALHYQGFQKNYYTTVLTAETEKRFNIPGNSTFLNDSSAVLLTGPALFPKVMKFQQEAIQIQDSALLKLNRDSAQQGKQTASSDKQVLRLTELGSGLSYKIRMCTFDNEVWKCTQEVMFTTPICPTDMK